MAGNLFGGGGGLGGNSGFAPMQGGAFGGIQGGNGFMVGNAKYGTAVLGGPDQVGMQFQREMAKNQNQLQRDLAGRQQAGETERAQIAAQAAELPAQLGQQRFNSVFPWLQSQFGANSAPTAAGVGGNQPQISAAPIWNDQQIQQQVNTSRAANDASTQAQQRQMRSQLGGMGYGANSPLAMALSGQMQAQNLQTNTANETTTRMNAAQGNNQRQFQGQQAQESQFEARQREQLQAQQIQASQRNALLSALAGLA